MTTVICNHSIGAGGTWIGPVFVTSFNAPESTIELDAPEAARLRALGAVRYVGEPDPRSVPHTPIFGVSWGVREPGIYDKPPPSTAW